MTIHELIERMNKQALDIAKLHGMVDSLIEHSRYTTERMNRIDAAVAHNNGVGTRPGELEKAVDNAIAALDKATAAHRPHRSGELGPELFTTPTKPRK